VKRLLKGENPQDDARSWVARFIDRSIRSLTVKHVTIFFDFLGCFMSVEEAHQDILQNMEFAIVESYRAQRNLIDAEVLTAIAVLVARLDK
jgi:hypothetical protein